MPSGSYFHLPLFGLPIFVHWTAPAVGAGAAFIGVVMQGPLTFVLSLWLTVFVVIVIHEIGHAVAGRIVGGWCGQALLLALTLLASRPWGTPGSALLDGLGLVVLISINLIVFVISVIPNGDNDGAKVLSLLRTMFARRAS